MSQIVAMKFLTIFKSLLKLMATKLPFTEEKQQKIASSVTKKAISRKTVRNRSFSEHKKKRRNKKLLLIKLHHQSLSLFWNLTPTNTLPKHRKMMFQILHLLQRMIFSPHLKQKQPDNYLPFWNLEVGFQKKTWLAVIF